MQMEASMHQALERSEFLLHYQPKVDLANGAICGIEALLRWAHPEKGLVSPAEFIPVLEETVHHSRGRMGHARSVPPDRAWQQAGLKVPPVAVNLSARSSSKRTWRPAFATSSGSRRRSLAIAVRDYRVAVDE